jgi:Leucine-rich repeat (LRR) protein
MHFAAAQGVVLQAEGAPAMRGAAHAFGNLSALVNLQLEGIELSGALRLGPSVTHVNTTRTTHTAVQVDAPESLESVSMTLGKLTGAVPSALLSAPSLVLLDLSGNSLSSLPAQWAAPSMLSLMLANNAIEVCTTALHALQRSCVRPLLCIVSHPAAAVLLHALMHAAVAGAHTSMPCAAAALMHARRRSRGAPKPLAAGLRSQPACHSR